MFFGLLTITMAFVASKLGDVARGAFTIRTAAAVSAAGGDAVSSAIREAIEGANREVTQGTGKVGAASKGSAATDTSTAGADREAI